MIREYNGGPSWIRTRELKRDQIYSLAVLTTHPKTHTKRLTQVMTIIEMLQATPHVLYTLMIYGIINLHTTHTKVVSTFGAPSQNRTGTDFRPWDFKSHASACSAKGAYAPRFFHVRSAVLTDGCLANHNLVHKEGVEPSNTGF